MKAFLATLWVTFALFFGASAFAKSAEIISCELMVGQPPAHYVLYTPINHFTNILLKSGVVREVIGLIRHYDQGSNDRAIAVSSDGKYMAFGVREGAPSPERIFSELAKYDEFAAQIGLKIPEKTGILISNRSGWPSLFQRTPTSFFEDGMTWIDMRTDFRSIHYAYSIPIMNHERTHLLLKRTFGKSAFVNLNIQVQEALCDFLPSMFHKTSPEMLIPDFESLRWKERPGGGGAYTQLLPVTLWQIFRRVDPLDRPALTMEFLRGLNEDYASHGLRYFLSHQEKDADVLIDQRDRAAELFVAVAKKLRPHLDFSGL